MYSEVIKPNPIYHQYVTEFLFVGKCLTLLFAPMPSLQYSYPTNFKNDFLSKILMSHLQTQFTTIIINGQGAIENFNFLSFFLLPYQKELTLQNVRAALANLFVQMIDEKPISEILFQYERPYTLVNPQTKTIFQSPNLFDQKAMFIKYRNFYEFSPHLSEENKTEKITFFNKFHLSTVNTFPYFQKLVNELLHMNDNEVFCFIQTFLHNLYLQTMKLIQIVQSVLKKEYTSNNIKSSNFQFGEQVCFIY
jgi:hypothetical protein